MVQIFSESDAQCWFLFKVKHDFYNYWKTSGLWIRICFFANPYLAGFLNADPAVLKMRIWIQL